MLENMNTKSFITKKINTIANVPERWCYSSFVQASQTKLIYNIALAFPFCFEAICNIFSCFRFRVLTRVVKIVFPSSLYVY